MSVDLRSPDERQGVIIPKHAGAAGEKPFSEISGIGREDIDPAADIFRIKEMEGFLHKPFGDGGAAENDETQRRVLAGF